MMELLADWAEKQPDEKVSLCPGSSACSIITVFVFANSLSPQTIVISQWTQCLSLVSDYLTERGVQHVKYQGDMNRNKRDLAVRHFMAKKKSQVMLLSLKCGGVGLNLTRANRQYSIRSVTHPCV